MAFNFTNISNIDKDSKLTVYGYIRSYEKLNKIHIPEGVVLILILFYGYETDEWDPKYISKYMKLTDKTLTQIKQGFGSSYGQRIIDSGIFKWRLKINQCKNYGFILGIRKIKDDEIDLPTNCWFTDGGYDKGYGFRSANARLTNDKGYGGGREYGIDPPNGSIIEMILDLDNLTLSYIIDGIDYGKAYHVEKSKYRLGLFLRYKGDSLTLL